MELDDLYQEYATMIYRFIYLKLIPFRVKVKYPHGSARSQRTNI